MTDREYLLVGGPQAGRRHRASHGEETICLHRRIPLPFFSLRDLPLTDNVVTVGRDYYTLVSIRSPFSGIVHFYKWQNISEAEAIRELLTYYRPEVFP